MRIIAKDQVAIPADIREKAGLLPNTDVTVRLDGDTVRIERADAGRKPSRGARMVAHLRGRGTAPMTTDAIMTLTRGE